MDDVEFDNAEHTQKEEEEEEKEYGVENSEEKNTKEENEPIEEHHKVDEEPAKETEHAKVEDEKVDDMKVDDVKTEDLKKEDLKKEDLKKEDLNKEDLNKEDLNKENVKTEHEEGNTVKEQSIELTTEPTNEHKVERKYKYITEHTVEDVSGYPKFSHLLLPNESKLKFIQNSFDFSNEKTIFEEPKFQPYLLLKDYTVQYMDPLIKKTRSRRFLCCC